MRWLILSSFFMQFLYADHLQDAWKEKESRAFFADLLPMRADGKINIPLSMKHIKLDIGLSWCAPMSQVWIAKEDDLIVFGFEPNPGARVLIEQGKCIPAHWATNYLSASHPIRTKSALPELLGSRFFLMPCALGLSEHKTTIFYVTSNDCGCSSIFPPTQLPVGEVLSVPILRLSQFFDVFPFDSHPIIDYIKIDAQGADLSIVKSAGNYLQERVVCVTLEPEQDHYQGAINSFQDIDNYMQNIGFVRYTSKNVGDPTYVNPKFMTYFIDQHELHIFQQ